MTGIGNAQLMEKEEIDEMEKEEIDEMEKEEIDMEMLRATGPDADSLIRISQYARWLAFRTVSASKAGHIGGPLSAMDLLTSLYFRELRIRPEQPDWADRDRFILSKGHSSIGLYAVMALRGYFPVAELATFDKGDSRLQGHPDMTKLPGIDMSSGSLGQGLSAGVGLALGARMAGKDSHTWVMLGDGEIQEGMVWEAVHVATRYQLGNLTAIIDWNGLQQYGWPLADEGGGRGNRRDPWARVDLAGVFRSFGWHVVELDGHDMSQIELAFASARKGGENAPPTVLLAKTVKGKGVSFAEGQYNWHTGLPSESELSIAHQELSIHEEGVI